MLKWKKPTQTTHFHFFQLPFSTTFSHVSPIYTYRHFADFANVIFLSLYYFSSSSLNSPLFNLFWSEKIINNFGTQKGTQCSRTGLMWAVGKWYKSEKSWDCRSMTSWPLFTAINYTGKVTAFCMTLCCIIFSLFLLLLCLSLLYWL